MNKQRWGIFYSGPLTFWLSFFFLIPIGIIIYYSLMSRDVFGGVKHFTLSWNAYASMADPSFIQVLITTLWISVLSTVLTIVIALPSAYYMARSKNATFLLLLIIVPFWINFLIRIFAWMAILGTEGFLNDILKFFGVVDEGIQFLYNPVAVIIVFVYSYLPYAILPLYSTIENFDFSLLEAARDLGATHRQSLIKVMLPAIRPGILTAVLFTFIPTFGAYAVPQLVGDKNTWMLGNVIAYELLRNRDYPKASAISILITVLTAVILLVYLFLQRRSSEIEKKGLLNE